MPKRKVLTEEGEIWRNPGPHTVWIQRFGPVGNQIDEVVYPGRTVVVTPTERSLNVEMSYDPMASVFNNGMLQPVQLIEGDEETAREIAENPNLMGETEMAELIAGHGNALRKRLESVSSMPLLQRMLTLAEKSDVSLSKMKAIQERIDSLSPKTNEVENLGRVGGPLPDAD